jgi:hypothetical protein
VAILLSDIEASVRAATDHDTDTQVTQAQAYAWINEEYFALRRRLADAVPDLYTKVSADFTLGAGITSQDVTAAPLSLSDFAKPRIVEIKNSPFYSPLETAGFMTADWGGSLSWRLRGTTIDLYPQDFVPGKTFRVKYITKPAKLVNPNDPVDVPDGAERVLVESVAARIRVRLDDDPSFHLQMRDKYWAEIRDSLVRQYVSTPQTIVDITGRY